MSMNEQKMGIYGLKSKILSADAYITSKGFTSAKYISDEVGGDKRLAIDAPSLLYVCMSNAVEYLLSEDTGGDFTLNDEILEFTRQLLARIADLTRDGFSLTFVFDGCGHPEKETCYRRRAECKRTAEKKLILFRENMIRPFTHIDNVTYKRLVAKSSSLRSIHYSTAIKLITRLNLTIIRAEYDAEFLCARLANIGLFDAVFSSDSDAFLLTDKPVIYSRHGPSYTCFRRRRLVDTLRLDDDDDDDVHRRLITAIGIARSDYNQSRLAPKFEEAYRIAIDDSEKYKSTEVYRNFFDTDDSTKYDIESTRPRQLNKRIFFDAVAYYIDKTALDSNMNKYVI